MNSTPAISVLMSVYNAKDTLAKSIDSILNQSFENFEFIIIDDGSTDETAQILERYTPKDSRIHVLTQENMGLTVALNHGLKIAQGTYIARQDADDFSYPDRLLKQFKIMEAAPDILLCGGNCDSIYPDGTTSSWGWDNDEKLQKSVFLKTPFAHSTAMMRTDAAKKLGGYDESYKTAQDMELWMRFAKTGRISMLSEPLIRRSVSSSAISKRHRYRQLYDAMRARWAHNTPSNRPFALYYGLRSFIINALPHRLLTHFSKKDFQHAN